MRKVSPYLVSLLLCTLFQRYLLRLSALFFHNDMEESKRTFTRFSHLCSSTKNKQKKTKKRYNLITIESLLSNNKSNHYKSILTPTRGKTCGLHCRNGTMIHTLKKTKDRGQHALVIYTKVALKMGSSLVPRVQRLE